MTAYVAQSSRDCCETFFSCSRSLAANSCTAFNARIEIHTLTLHKLAILSLFLGLFARGKARIDISDLTALF